MRTIIISTRGPENWDALGSALLRRPLAGITYFLSYRFQDVDRRRYPTAVTPLALTASSPLPSNAQHE